MQKIEAVAKKLQDQCIADQEEHSTAQKHFHAVTAGLSSNKDGEDASLNEQLMGEKVFDLICIPRMHVCV